MAELGESLSERELDVLQNLASGATNKEIASDLSISQNTVKVHLRNIYAKLGVSSRTEATTAAIQLGYLNVLGQESETAVAIAPAAAPVIETVSDPDPKTPPNGDQAGTTIAAADVDQPETAVSTQKKRGWRIPALVGLLVISLIAILLLSLQVFTALTPTPTPEPFIEEPIGDTRWAVSREMPEGRANMAVVAVGLNLYQIGGETELGVDDAVYIFNSSTRAWQEGASKPTAVADVTAVDLYGEIYVPGGRLADGQPTAAVEVYSPAQNAWRPVAALPQPVSGGLALTDGAFVYLFGGWNGSKYLNTAYVYDPGADTWRPLPDMPIASAFASGGELSNQLVIVGGADGEKNLAACHLFDPLTEGWGVCPDMLLPRAGAGAAVLLNKLYVIGGGMNAGEEIPFSEVYDPNSQTWQVLNTPRLEESGSWSNLGVSHIETRIYTLGGREEDGYLASNLIYAPLVYQTFIPAATSGDGE